MKLAWIGTGIMGCAMASHLCKAGHELTVYTRTKEKAATLLDMGATWAKSPLEAASNADITFSIVGYPADVEEVMLGNNGALHGLKTGGILCDMTTSCPDLAKKIALEAIKKNCLSVDAPVTGGDIGAQNATLSIFVGGSNEAYTKLKPLLNVMGKKVVYCGEAGMGQKAKLGNQIAVAGLIFSVCESITFVQKAGLDLNLWLETISTGAAGSNAMNALGPRVANNNFEPGFFVEHFVKDLKLCLEQCKQMNLNLPGLNLAEQTFSNLVAQGYGRDGTQVLAKALTENKL